MGRNSVHGYKYRTEVGSAVPNVIQRMYRVMRERGCGRTLILVLNRGWDCSIKCYATHVIGSCGSVSRRTLILLNRGWVCSNIASH
jgi:hypothetical protein